MLTYIVRRAIYAVLVMLGVNLLTFVLFFSVNTPDDMARLQLGRRVTAEAVERWKAERGYDRPLYVNEKAQGLGKLTNTVFFDTSLGMFKLDLGRTNEGRDIANEVSQRIVPSMALALPVFCITVAVAILFALGLMLFRSSWLDTSGVVFLVALMSISSLFFIIIGQFFFSKLMRLAPLSGFVPGPDMFMFVSLPIAVLVLARLGPDSRLYRTIYLEELSKDYVRTARSKGLGEFQILLRHVLRNSLIPIITSSGLLLPVLFVGSIVTETFFSIPGLGSFTYEGITQQDFNIVRAMVFFGSGLYIFAFLVTDVAYSVADPRIRLN
jgi:peptide/nickel transport system permease protein